MKKIQQVMEENKEALHSMIVLRRAVDTIDKNEIPLIKQHGLTFSQFGVLEILYNKGTLRIQDLIDKTLSTSGNMTVVIRNMVRDDYVSRSVDPSDCRASLISLTPKGKKLIEKILPEHYANVGHIFSVLTDEEQVLLSDLLKKFKNL